MVLPTSGSISISDINSCARFTNGNMGINTTSPNYNLDINGTLKATTITAGNILATTSISSGAVNATNSTVTNAVSTNASSGTLNLSTGLTAGTILATTSISSGEINATNSTVTNLYSLNSTLSNLRSTLSSIGTLRTDLGVMTEALMTKASISTSLTVPNLLVTTSVSSGAVYATNSTVTNFVATSITAGPIFATNNVNASQTIVVQNTNSGSSAYSALTLTTDQASNFNIFKNSTTRTADGGANTATIRNDGGPLRLQSNTGMGIWVGSTGNVGINTTTPSAILNVNGDSTGTNGTVLITGGDSFGHSLHIASQASHKRLGFNHNGTVGNIFSYEYGTGPQNLILQYAGGNVGIGTSSPSTKLNVAGGADVFGTLRVGGSSSSTGFNINLGTTGAVDSFRSGYLYGDGTTIYLTNQQNGALNFGTNNTWNRLVITAAGNVGIGLDTPANNGLQINSGELQLGPKTTSAFHMYAVNGNLEFFSGNWGAGIYAGKWTNSGLQVVGSLSKGSGTFDIKHPLHPNDETKRLVHSFIEGPRCDLIYRGEVQLVNGTATINLDSDCVAEPGCEMTQGTFEALCANPHFFLQNPSSFSRLKGNIQGNILTIECEDQDSNDIVYWSVIAERKDNTVKQWNRTNENGYLITEYDKDDVPSL